MLLTMEEMGLLHKCTIKGANGKLKAKEGLSSAEKDRLASMDELNLNTYGEHLIENFEELS